eukprot:1146567-Pelagomonas_calceolata.AAC.4
MCAYLLHMYALQGHRVSHPSYLCLFQIHEVNGLIQPNKLKARHAVTHQQGWPEHAVPYMLFRSKT